MPDKLIRDYAPITSPADADVVLADDTTRYGTITLTTLAESVLDRIIQRSTATPEGVDSIPIYDDSASESARVTITALSTLMSQQRELQAPRVVAVGASRALTDADSGAVLVVDGGGSTVDLVFRDTSGGVEMGPPLAIEIVSINDSDTVTMSTDSGSTLFLRGEGPQPDPATITIAPFGVVSCVLIDDDVLLVAGDAEL